MIFIALGANLPGRYGAPLETLEAAIEAIDAYEGICVLRRSPVYISAPVPISEQPWYHNAVISIQTDLKPRALLEVLMAIEADFGRERGERNAARVLDLDILAYQDDIIQEEGLIVPHPRMAERAFVLLPLFDIAPDWCDPDGQRLIDLVSALPVGQDIQRLEDEKRANIQ